jgi:geranylgeranyl pyrophosphate synthase
VISTADPAAFVERTRVAVGGVIDRWCARLRSEAPGRVTEAMVYSLTVPGKRLRPALVMAAYSGLGGTGEAAELAAAVEIVHTYSLVHDDLPCMDDDDLRRGRPTTHRRFDVPTATEAGFRLVPLSARVLAAGSRRLSLSRARSRRVAVELYRAAGAGGMIGGQVLDLEAEGTEISQDSLVLIHARKTGALITASAVIGAVAAGGDDEQVEAVRDFGHDVGLAFQIVDDVLDATRTSDELGKTAGKDAAQRKASFAEVVGADAALADARARASRAVARLRQHRIDSNLLAGLAQVVVERQH